MRIPIICWDCSENRRLRIEQEYLEKGLPAPIGIPFSNDDITLVVIEDSNAYATCCRNGHQLQMALQCQKFELLYESGIVAFHMGFQREAVASIASATERFWEFSLEVFFEHAGLKTAQFRASWASVKKQSERQLGAFIFLYATNFQKPFLFDSRKADFERMSSFRNKVIHEGIFPSKNEAVEYARHVFELIQATRNELREQMPQALTTIEHRHISSASNSASQLAGTAMPDADKRSRGVSTLGIPLMLSSFSQDENFDGKFEQSKNMMFLWGLPASLQD